GDAYYEEKDAPHLGEDCRQPVPEGSMPFYRRKHIFAWVGLAVIIIDQLTKWRVEATIPLNTSLAPIPRLYPYFQFSHVANTGTFFGLFPSAKWIFAILAIVVAFGLAYFNYHLPAQSLKLRLALGLLFGGAMGNLIDRVRLGHVTDFMNVNLRPLLHPLIDIPILDWAVFNVADMAISAGIVDHPSAAENADDDVQNEAAYHAE
ncbi:MAG: signal peptidase II, partial [Anaerolineae bacterium]